MPWGSEGQQQPEWKEEQGRAGWREQAVRAATGAEGLEGRARPSGLRGSREGSAGWQTGQGQCQGESGPAGRMQAGSPIVTGSEKEG